MPVSPVHNSPPSASWLLRFLLLSPQSRGSCRGWRTSRRWRCLGCWGEPTPGPNAEGPKCRSAQRRLKSGTPQLPPPPSPAERCNLGHSQLHMIKDVIMSFTSAECIFTASSVFIENQNYCECSFIQKKMFYLFLHLNIHLRKYLQGIIWL